MNLVTKNLITITLLMPLLGFHWHDPPITPDFSIIGVETCPKIRSAMRRMGPYKDYKWHKDTNTLYVKVQGEWLILNH